MTAPNSLKSILDFIFLEYATYKNNVSFQNNVILLGDILERKLFECILQAGNQVFADGEKEGLNLKLIFLIQKCLILVVCRAKAV